MVIARLARDAGIDIGTTDSGIGSVRSRGVRGSMSPREALEKLLAGTGYRAVVIDETSFRIVRAPVRKPSKPEPAQPVQIVDESDIIVTAGKRDAPLLRYPGAVSMVQAGAGSGFGVGDRRDMHMIASDMAILQSTELGDGRNKLFVRGIADSSFTGPTRSTASVYFGEAQLGYNGADPNLNLYDVDRIEVLEGPQGALYGAGSIGGIVRILPHVPDAKRIAASAMAAGIATQSGGFGHELAAMANLPLLSDRVAIRVVGYRSVDGGYIDDIGRGLTNINRKETWGARAALRVTPGDGWTIDLSGVVQTNEAPDTQYAIRGMPTRTRASTIAQPFEGDFGLVQVVIRKAWDSGLQLVAASARVHHHSDDRFDATLRTRPNVPLAYDTHDRNRMETHELRLSRSVANGNSWLAGLSYIKDSDRIERTLGAPSNPVDITGVTNDAKDISGFGEGTVALTPRISATLGGRLTRALTDSDPTFIRRGTAFIRGKTSFRFSPTAGASALLAPRLALFVRYGSGFRTGGLAVAPGVGRVSNFTPDTIHVLETGLRLQRSGPTGLAASAGLSRARWSQIQADLVDRRGFPYTTNIGNGRITGLEASADWIPMAGLSLSGALFLTKSSLYDPVLALARQKGDRLADTPRAAANAAASYKWKGAADQIWTVRATSRYVGHSYVGFGPMLDISQGDYTLLGAGIGWRRKGIGIDLDLDNLANSHRNQFSLGNPFGVADRNQITPLRPRNLRVTVTAGF